MRRASLAQSIRALAPVAMHRSYKDIRKSRPPRINQRKRQNHQHKATPQRLVLPSGTELVALVSVRAHGDLTVQARQSRPPHSPQDSLPTPLAQPVKRGRPFFTGPSSVPRTQQVPQPGRGRVPQPGRQVERQKGPAGWLAGWAWLATAGPSAGGGWVLLWLALVGRGKLAGWLAGWLAIWVTGQMPGCLATSEADGPVFADDCQPAGLSA